MNRSVPDYHTPEDRRDGPTPLPPSFGPWPWPSFSSPVRWCCSLRSSAPLSGGGPRVREIRHVIFEEQDLTRARAAFYALPVYEPQKVLIGFGLGRQLQTGRHAIA